MSYEIEANYEKQWLFPPSLEELLGGDHPARMIRAFVEQQDLESLGFKTRKSEDGRPSYSSGLLLKVWLYGYVNANRSCRGLERACLDQIGMLWLTGMNNPDHTTLWRFWRDNQKAIRKRDHLNPGDEDARVMKCRSENRFAYNAQAVADEASRLIVAAEVVTDESDNYQLVPMLGQVEENLGRVAEQTVADAGYKAITGLSGAEEKNYSVMVNLAEPQDEPYHASRFSYDREKDQCICPRGERLEFERTKARDKVEPYLVRVYTCKNYLQCPVRWQCSSSKTGRTVQIHPNHDALVRQREKHKDEAMRALLKRRCAIIEPVFGWGKQCMGFRRWTVRGLEKVKTQWLLMCTAINLRLLHKHWVSGKLRFA